MICKMDRKMIIQRLAFAKYLIYKGNIESSNAEPLSSVSILNYHDALEFAFDLVLTDKGISMNGLSFMQYFDKVNKWLKANTKTEISLRPSLEKLKDRRVNLKHKGIFPSKTDIEESRITVNNLFEELCKNVYGLDIKDISLIELINNTRVKGFIKEAIDNYPINQKEPMEKISLAFEFLLRDYESSKADFLSRSPFYFGKDMTFLSSFHMNLKSGDKFAEFVDKTKESIEAMQKTVKILAFGLDYKKYIKFRLIIPEPIWFIGSDMPKVHLPQNPQISQSDFDFCIAYLIECALKLQEFDFEIEKKRHA